MAKKISSFKTAIIHDFLREYGGAERVLEKLHELYPEAPVYTAFLDKQALGKHWQRFSDWDIRQTWFKKIPLHKKLYSPLRFLAPHAFADLDLSQYDLVISSSNAFMAKGVTAPKGIHICYCHTPPRGLYGYSTMSNWKKNLVVKVCGQLINHYMRVVDFKLAQKVDYFIANSEETQKRISKFYRRESKVIYPPVEVEKITKQIDVNQDREYFFYVNRLGLQKHPELAVQACTQLQVPLKVAGTGQMLPRLQEMAGPSIEFLGAVSDEELFKLYAGATALLYPVEDEDFGMVPIEAMAAGTPVIAHRSGGPVETIISDKTGLFINSFKVQSLASAIQRSEQIKWDHELISRHAKQFDQSQFKLKLKQFIKEIS